VGALNIPEGIVKTLVIGDVGAGKTSLIKRSSGKLFSQSYKSTIGVDFALVVRGEYRIQLWDIAGPERFATMTRVYYKEAKVAFITYDVMRSSTFDALGKWLQDLRAKLAGDQQPLIYLVGCKVDMAETQERAVPTNVAEDWASQHGLNGFLETSAKTGQNVEELLARLVRDIGNTGERMLLPSQDAWNRMTHGRTNGNSSGQGQWCTVG